MKKDYDIVKHMKEQSGWGWSSSSLLPDVDEDAREKYIAVSISYLYFLRDLMISLQQYPESKMFFSKPFPLYEGIADLLGDSRAIGSVSYDPRLSTEALQMDADTQNPSIPHIAIDPVLEEMSHASQGVPEDKGEGSVCIYFHLCADLTYKSNLP